LAAGAAAEQGRGHVEIEVLAGDVSRASDRAALAEGVRAILAREGSVLHCLVHNAAVMGEVGPPSALSEEGFRETMATNVEGPLFLTRGLADDLALSPRGGRVLHLSSGAAHSALRGWLEYCTSKAALLQLMRCLDADLAPKVRVGSAMPGVVDTDMQASIRNCEFPDVAYFRSLRRAPGEGIGQGPPAVPSSTALDRPDNVAQFLAWLLLDVPGDEFGGQEWDINDQSTQRRWLSQESGAAVADESWF